MPTERIFRSLSAVYFIRIWRDFILSSKFRILTEHFITSNSFKAIEINARNLIMLIRKFRDEKNPNFFIPPLFSSQISEKSFRQFRSMGTVNFTKINFSVLELLYMIRRVEVQNKILNFNLLDKGVKFPKFEVDRIKTKIYTLPSEGKIAGALGRSKVVAMEDAKSFGMTFDEVSIDNYKIPYKKICGMNIDDHDDVNEDDDILDDILDDTEWNNDHDEMVT